MVQYRHCWWYFIQPSPREGESVCVCVCMCVCGFTSKVYSSGFSSDVRCRLRCAARPDLKEKMNNSKQPDYALAGSKGGRCPIITQI